MAATRKKIITPNRVLIAIFCSIIALYSQASFAEAADCKFGEYDLTRLQSFNPWKAGHNKTDISFDIHLCDTPSHSSCSGGISVSGLNMTTNTTASYGNCSLHNSTTESPDGELLVLVKGDSCPLLSGELYTTIIYFKCGKKLGRPVYLGDFGCSFYFEWESFEFCKDLVHPANEIPCYVFNNSQLIDLSPLTKLKGGYLVDSENNRDFYINVCRDINPDGATSSCQNSSSSCRVIGGTGASMGQPTTKLQIQDHEIKMTYTTTQKAEGCIDNPVTVVFFRCPERGGSKEPMLINDFMCKIDIEWFTEYACPQETLTSDTCKLTMESHNIDVDLSSLRRMHPSASPASPYNVSVTEGKDSYIYYLNVCGQLGISCGNTHTGHEAACQVKQNDGLDPGKIIGDFHHMTLRYSDGELSLTYKDGDQCHTNVRRNTIINFQCQQDAAQDGRGQPEFRGEDNCTYVFDWKTRYACINHPGDTACDVKHGGKLFDLSDLTIEKGKNWLALSDISGETSYQYYINVCHDVLRSDGAESCPPGAAVCRKDHDGKNSVSLGSYTTGLQYDPVTQNIYINYTMSSASDHECSGLINTIITFICRPGALESGPALIEKSLDGCMYRFEWYTAAACPMSHQHGKDCTVVDEQAGYSFDLSGLTKKSGDGYKVSVGDYDYYINVCDKIGGQHCKDAPHDNAAVCQVKKDGSQEFKTGEPSQNLEYFNGVLNLTYTNGEQYHDQNLRETEIAFICDTEAGAGSPEFLAERNHTYSFKWLTAFACPTQPIECVVEDENGKQYDLSSLSKSASGENWVVLDDSVPSQQRKFYINVCRSLAPIHGITSTGCDLNAAACVTSINSQNLQESVAIGNLGQAKTRPKLNVARDSYVSLVYTDGAQCPDGGAGARYNITISFICIEGQQSRGPGVPRKVGPCSYEIIWDTSAACALKETDSGGSSAGACAITDNNYTYSLQTLNKSNGSFYTAQTPDKSRTFRLNICGAVPSPSCTPIMGKSTSVCEVKSSGTVALAVAESVDLEFMEEKNIMVTYSGLRQSFGNQAKVQIELACNLEADETANITFVSQVGYLYLFRLETPISCPRQQVDCMVQDRAGRQYDLTPLAKVTGNFYVQDSRTIFKHLHYLINVCRPVNVPAGFTCPGGPIGGCQLGGPVSYGLGYVKSKPIVADDGTITLRYVGGSVCHRGTPQEARRSLRINFYCSQVESNPQFDGESLTCEYIFTWRTPSACPLQRSVGSECKVADPLFNYQFDLTPLRKSDSNYVAPKDKYNYLLNVCGPLHTPPTGCEEMGVCQTRAPLKSLSSPVAAGKANSKLIYDAGELSLVYDEGKEKCHGNFTRKTIITFVCDHSQAGAGSGPHALTELGDCTYPFTWSTSLACPPHTIVDCTFAGGYDLSSLALSGANYVKSYDNVSYIINICRSLVHRKGETCPFNAAACEINATETDFSKKYKSLGEVTSNPVSMEDGKLVIRYANGAPCSTGGKMSTLIILSCDSTPGAGEAGPSSHFVRDNCEHGFVWNTPAACPIVPGSDTNVGGDCKAMNPRTNYEFDLSKLKKTNEAYVVNDREGHHYRLNVCGPVTGTSCSSSNTTGSCQSEINNQARSFNAGNANAKLIYQGNGLLMLNYSGGDICHHNNVTRTTIINFICNEGAGNGVPTYIDGSDGCVYYFDWHTELVCEEKVLCEVSADGQTFDLTPLVKNSGHHLATIDIPGTSNADSKNTQGTFYINVCRPLNPIFNTLCPAGSAACREVRGEQPQSLGQARSPPVYDSARKEIILTYDHGQPCASDSSQNASSRIIFRCKRGPSQGTPRLVDVSQSCEYVFEWETNVICSDDAVEKETSNCTYYDQRTEFLYDLTPLNGVQEIASPQGGKFSIQACGALPSNLSDSCHGAAVCLAGSNGVGSVSLQNGSYGSASSGVFQMDEEQLKLTFLNGQKCQHGDKIALTHIFFECDHDAGNGRPTHLPHFQCELNFKWRTSLVCPPLVQDCAVSSGDTTFDLSILSQTRESWEFDSMDDGNRYWLNLCQSVHGEAHKQQCDPNAAVCRKSKDETVDKLGDVRSQSTTVEANGTVVFTYSRGTSACSSGRRRSNNPLAKTVVRLTCGPTVGTPRLTPRKDRENCLFEFTWKTRAVCKKDSMPQELKDINQVVHDPRSGGSIDLRPLLKGGNHHAFDGKYQYMVSLEGHLSLDHSNPASSACNTAAICQQLRDNATHHQNLGSYASRKYYLNEDQLEVEYTSSDKCTGKYSNKNVKSIITFSCASDSNTRTDPVLLYRTVDCTYIFAWDTPAACIQAKVELATGNSGENSKSADGGGGKSGGFSNTTLATIVSVFSALLIICLLAIYLHKPERRADAASKLKRIVFCRRTTENEIRYSVLAQMEDDPEVNHVGSNPFEEDEMENELQNGDTVKVTSGYHDDSDDDMLL
ncbi:cation-independent mannose-6-phosphate receptor-like isoform X2 [Littorina saxatilis]|uniref:MRH domain-containing protein n=1 Tax=Littorina saxatilis TaxID=31220 RepID=A0AAN9BKB3_9CAEN